MKRWMTTALLSMSLWLGAGAQAAEAKLAVAPFEADSLAQIVRTHAGKPFVLILWSLDCVYCQASLNALAEQKRSHPALEIVTLSTDGVGDPQTDALVEQRLRKLALTTNAWGFGAAPPEQLRYAIDPKWHGEMPRSYWFDAQGRRTPHSGVLTPATIDQLTAKSAL
ncbi:hypothetical protein H3H36_12585 [Duganella sp. FT3S]|uniref:Thioredoxin domain-containing protein n=2 Tax=Rugamonas fusca TaxID=2758568 RepID=A0A7W2EI36_9BURK|nr:hypothetical protein [Rugamonas fusca]